MTSMFELFCSLIQLSILHKNNDHIFTNQGPHPNNNNKTGNILVGISKLIYNIQSFGFFKCVDILNRLMRNKSTTQCHDLIHRCSFQGMPIYTFIIPLIEHMHVRIYILVY